MQKGLTIGIDGLATALMAADLIAHDLEKLDTSLIVEEGTNGQQYTKVNPLLKANAEAQEAVNHKLKALGLHIKEGLKGERKESPIVALMARLAESNDD